MVKSITSNVNNSAFTPFSTSSVDYAICKPITKKQEEHEKEFKANTLGYKIGVTALITGLGVLGLMKGMPRSTRSRFNKVFRKLSEKIETITSKNNKLSFVQTVYVKTLRGVQSGFSKSKALLNICLFKDAGPQIKAKKYPWLDKTFKAINGFFERLSVRTCHKSYAKTASSFENMSVKIAQVNEQLLKENPNKVINGKTVRDWVKEIEKRNASVNAEYQKSFGGVARDKRIKGMKSKMSDLDQRVYDSTWGLIKKGKLFKDKNLYQTFLAEEFVAPQKIELTKTVHSLRRPISNSIEDNYLELNGIMDNLEAFIDPADKNSRLLLKKAQGLAAEYRTLGDFGPDTERKQLSHNISNVLKELNSYISKSGRYDVEDAEKAVKYIEELRSVLSDRKNGGVQEILNIYSHILPDKEYRQVKKVADTATGSLNNSIHIETEKLFDKFRDLAIGSAPMDTLGMLIPLGCIGWGLAQADDNDERISAGLRYGVPAVGALSTILYCTAGLMSGGQAVLFAVLADFGIHHVGKYIDEKRKDLKKHPINLNNISFPDLSLGDFTLVKSKN